MTARRKADGSSTVAAQIRAYHAQLPPASRRVVKALEKEVSTAVPHATRAFSYRIPAFAIGGKILIWCAGWQEHVGMYPVTPAMQQAGSAALEPYRHARGALRFPLVRPLPRALIRLLIKARVAEMTNSRDQ